MSYDLMPNLDITAKTGRVYAASTDTVGFTNFGRIRAALTNPTGSGRIIHLIGIASTNSSGASGTIRQWANPTTGVPTALAPIPARNCLITLTPDPTAVPKGVFYADSGTFNTVSTTSPGLAAMAGGTTLPTLVIPNQDRQVFGPSPLLLYPGTTLGWDATFGAVSISGNSIITVYWYEENLS